MSRERVWLRSPPHLRATYSGFEWTLAYESPKHSVVYCLSRDGTPELFLKLAEVGHFPGLPAEADRTRWARRHLPVPVVVAQGNEESVDWLVTYRLPGKNGTHPDPMKDPAALTRSLARGLRSFHDRAPVKACPFDFRLEAALRHVRERLTSGLIDPHRDFHDEFSHLSPAAAVQHLEATLPGSEDLVVCHGDYCLPNILIQDGQATGFVDLGELGVADRWWDLAVATTHLVCGLPASGKTTYARALCADAKRCYFSLDQWLITAYGPYQIEVVGHREHVRRVLACRDLIWSSATPLLALDADVILDDGFFLAENRRQFIARSKAVGADVTIHVLHTPLDVLRERLHRRNASLPRYNFRIDPGMLSAFVEIFEEPTLDEGAHIVRVDGTDYTPIQLFPG